MLTGSLEGCWYTNILTSKNNGSPSGVYQERGVEIFVGSLNGGDPGEVRDDLQVLVEVGSGCVHRAYVEVHGRCQHPLIAGSGTGGFAGVTGRLDIKDDVATGSSSTGVTSPSRDASSADRVL